MILAGEMMVPQHTHFPNHFTMFFMFGLQPQSPLYTSTPLHPPSMLRALLPLSLIPCSVFSKLVLCSALSSYILSYIHPHNRRERDFAESPLYQLKPKLFSATCFWAHWEFVLLPDTLTLHRHFLIHLYKNEGETMIILVFIKARLEELVRLLCQERFLLALEVSPDLGL